MSKWIGAMIRYALEKNALELASKKQATLQAQITKLEAQIAQLEAQIVELEAQNK